MMQLFNIQKTSEAFWSRYLKKIEKKSYFLNSIFSLKKKPIMSCTLMMTKKYTSLIKSIQPTIVLLMPCQESLICPNSLPELVTTMVRSVVNEHCDLNNFQSIGKHIWQMFLSTNPHVVPSSKQQIKCLKLTKCPPFPIWPILHSMWKEIMFLGMVKLIFHQQYNMVYVWIIGKIGQSRGESESRTTTFRYTYRFLLPFIRSILYCICLIYTSHLRPKTVTVACYTVNYCESNFWPNKVMAKKLVTSVGLCYVT